MRLALNPDRYQIERDEAEPSRFERARRRGIVNTFLARRSYWGVSDWLSARTVGHDRLPRFLSLDEAVAHFRPLVMQGGPNIDQMRARYVVARYFRMAGREWL